MAHRQMRAYRRAQRRHDKNPTPHSEAVMERLWANLKRHAIEARVGLA